MNLKRVVESASKIFGAFPENGAQHATLQGGPHMQRYWSAELYLDYWNSCATRDREQAFGLVNNASNSTSGPC